MSTDLRDRLSDAYPQTDIASPPADLLWRQGRRRHRLRNAAIGGVVTATVGVGGLVASAIAPLPSAPQAPSVLTTTGSDAEEEDPGGVGADGVPAVPEPAIPGDLAVPDDAARFDVTLFLCDGRTCPAITPDQQRQLHDDLEAVPAVAEVFFESKDQAHARFQALFEAQPELADSVDLDAVPPSLRVKLHDPEQVGPIVEQFASYPGVEELVDQDSCSPGFCEGFVPEVADPS